MIALAYIRRSKNSKKRPSASPERQAANIRDFCAAKGWEAEWFRDDEGHRSGLSESGRPAWLQLKARLERARPGEIAAVVVNSLDRSSRRAKDFFNFLDLCQAKRADFVAVTQPYLDTTTPYGRAMVGNLIIFAQLEAEIDGERVAEDVAFRQSEGVMWGPAPLGYDAVVAPQDGARFKIRQPNEDAPLVRRLFEVYRAGDISMRALAREANTWAAAHVAGGFWRMRRRDGSRVPFTFRSIESILDNAPIYGGQVVRFRGRDAEEAFVGKHEAIIDDELVRAVLAARERRQDKRLVAGRRAAPHLYLLRGLLVCGTCGQRYRGQFVNGRPRYWHGPGSHGTARVDAAVLDADVLGRFAGWRLPADVARALVARPATIVEPPSDDEVTGQVAQLRAQLAREKDMYAMGDRTRADYVQRRNEIEAAIARVAPRSERGADLQDTAAVIQQLQILLAGVGQAAIGEQRALLATLFERLETDGHSITALVARPWFEQLVKEVVELYPQPALTVQLARCLEGCTPDATPYRDREADRNARIRELRANGWTFRAIGVELGLSLQRVEQIVKGRT